MDVDLIGRVRNNPLPRTKPLLAVFEAITNSIQAIHGRGTGRGRIDVRFIRDMTQIPLDLEQPLTQPIKSVIVVDDGEGFTSDNYRSFNRSDSTHKQNRGGKGVGRLFWLSGFDRARIDSTYKEGTSWHRRSFTFCLPSSIIEDKIIDLQDGTHRTEITLENLKKAYEPAFPKRLTTIAARIIEHFIPYFLRGDMPEVVIRDERETISLDEAFNSTP